MAYNLEDPLAFDNSADVPDPEDEYGKEETKIPESKQESEDRIGDLLKQKHSDGELTESQINLEEKVIDNEIRSLITKQQKFKITFVTVGGKGTDGVLIYIAMSKYKKETISHLRK